MPKFESNNTIYDIPDNIVQQFLTDNPNAIEVSAEEPGKITPPKEDNQGVPVEENVTPEIQPTATELLSEDILSESPGAKIDYINALTDPEADKYEIIKNRYFINTSDPIRGAEKSAQEEANKKYLESLPKKFDKGIFTLEEKKAYDKYKEKNVLDSSLLKDVYVRPINPETLEPYTGIEMFENVLEDFIPGLKMQAVALKNMGAEFISKAAGKDASDFLLGNRDLNSKIVKKNNKYFYEKNGVISGEIGEQTKKVQKELYDDYIALQESMQYKGSISEGFEKKDFASTIAGIGNAFSGAVQTMGPAFVTSGYSLYPQVAGPMFMDFNISKAKALYKDDPNAFDKLIENDQLDFNTPAALSLLSTLSEKIGFSSVSKAISAAPFTGQAFVKTLWAGGTEAGTGYAQFLIEETNKNLGKQLSIEEALKETSKVLFSPEALEASLQEAFGGIGMSVAGSGIKALRGMRADTYPTIQEDINKLSDLKQKYKSSKEDIVSEGIQKQIIELEDKIKNGVTRSNSVFLNSSEKDIADIDNLVDLKDKQIERSKKLIEAKDKGEISEQEYLDALEGYKQSFISAKNKIKGITKPISEEANKSAQQVENLYNEKGKNAISEIIELYKPMAERLAMKRRNVPGFDKQLLTDEILTGKRGILDLINEYDPKKNPGVTLPMYVNKFVAKRAIEASQRILKTEFETDVTEAKAVTDTVTAETEIETQEQIKQEVKTELAKDLNLTEETQNEVIAAVEKTLGTKLPAVTDKKFRQALTTGFRNELTNTFKTIFGKTAAYEQFLRDNFEKIYPAIPQETINRNFKEFNEPVLDPKTGKQLRERTAEGKKVFKKRDIAKAEFINYFLNAPGNVKGARKTSLAKVLADEIGLDNVLTSLSKPEVVEKFKAIQELQEQEVPSNFRAVISKAINRIDNLITALDEFEQDKSILKSDFGLTVPAIKVIKLFLKSVKAGLKAGLTIEKAVSNALKNIDKYSKAEKLSPQEQTIVKKAAKSIPAKDYTSKPAKDIINRIDKEYEKLFKEEQSKAIDEVLIPLYKDKVKDKTKEQRVELAKEFWTLYWRTFQRIKGTNKNEMYSIINNIFGKDFKFTNKLVDGKKFEPNKIDQTKTARFVEKFKNNKEKTITEQHQQADYNFNNFINLLISLKEKYNNKEISIDSVYFLLKSTGADMNSVGKRIQRLGNNTDIEALNANKQMTLEHNSPFDFTLKNILLPFIINDIKSSKELVNILKLQKLELIDESKAAKLNETKGLNLKTTMPDGYKITDDPIIRLLKIYPNLQKQKIKNKKSLNKDFNKILEESTGVKWTERFSPAKARVMAKGKGKGAIFVPYSADDFVGLLYTTLAGKEKGNQQMDWYRENLLRPFSRGIQAYEAEKQRAMREWSVLKQRAKKDVPGGLKKENESGFTNEQSLRMYMWQKQGFDIPGINKGEVNNAIRAIKKNDKFKSFADTLMGLNPEGYPSPEANWIDGDITSDLIGYVNGAKRSEFLSEWKENKDIIFSEKNITKLRGLYGEKYVEALENILYRMEKGVNRKMGQSKQERAWMDWVNNSVGSIMFFNARSAVLQTLSTVNFINFSDNNPINAAAALANFGQYRKDFVKLFNSDFLKQRRSGLQTDISADEIAKATKGNETSPRALFNALLKIGFTPTQIADSFAIASGGATFYRNRIRKYKKEGLEQKEAEQEAFTDFQEIAEETQQSSRPDRVSMEQAGSLGRVVLAFANTPMQYARLQKKAALDLVNGRGDWKTNISKIAYYGVIQNIIFSALQSALFALLFDDEEEVDAKGKYYRIANSSADSLLRGTGVYGAAAATVKNVILEIINQSKKDRPDYTKAAIAATSISPPINSKLRKLISAGNTFKYKESREKVFTEGFSLDNPALLATGKVISAGTNVPADRVVQKLDNVYTAMQPETELWQSIALSLGWTEWDLGMIESQAKKSNTPLRKGRKTIKRKSIKRKSIKRKSIQ